MNKIIWSQLAQDTYLHTIEYLVDNWSANTAADFDNKVTKLLSGLENFKNLCPSSPSKPDLRRCIITKQTSLIYRVVGDKIVLVVFLDNRQEFSF